MNTMQNNNECPWLTFRIQNQDFAINSEKVMSITILPEEITPIPNTSNHIRGLLNLRGSIIPLVNTRSLFQMPDVDEEVKAFKKLMATQITNHSAWVNSLIESVEKNVEFTGVINPHLCEFGVWYDSFSTNNMSLKTHFKKIEIPHKELHNAGAEIKELMRSNSQEDKKMVQNKLSVLENTTIVQLKALLGEASDILKNSYREMVVVLSRGNQKLGLIVDEVVSIEALLSLTTESQIESLENNDYIVNVAKSDKSDDLILLLDEDMIIDSLKQHSEKLIKSEETLV